MTNNITRLSEARKQIQIVAEQIDDQDLVEDLQQAERIVETIEGDISEHEGT